VFIVVVGGGGVGASIAEYFSKRGDRVVVIEKKRELCDRLVKSIDAVVYCGDVKSTRLLRDAEVEKADILFAVTGSDSVNLWEAPRDRPLQGLSNEAFLKASLAA